MRLLSFLFAALFLTACTHSIYQAADLETITDQHTTIAILQPKVEYLNARPESKRWSRVPAKEAIAEGFQLGLTNWIRDQQQRGKLDIRVIDVEVTNERLADASTSDYAQLARELGVDAVMVSRLRYDTRHDYLPRFLQTPNEQMLTSRVYLNLFTPEEGLIWSYKNVGHRGFRSYDGLVNELMFNGRNQLPYGVAK